MPVFLRNTIHLLALLAALTLSAREQTDTLKVLSGIRGADVTVYNLYRENRATDRAKAMEYAELFLSSADTTAAVPLLAAVCDELADWYEYDRSLFSRPSAGGAGRWRSMSRSATVTTRRWPNTGSPANTPASGSTTAPCNTSPRQ